MKKKKEKKNDRISSFCRCHCVIDGSNRMCVHKTFPVSPFYRKTREGEKMYM